jgi:hypothetical protein
MILNKIRLAYGFVVDSNLTVHHNVFLQLQIMPTWYYFDRPTHLAFHDLTSIYSPPRNLQSLLGLGLKFCPSPRFSQSSINESIERFKRDLFCKTYFAGQVRNDSMFDIKLHVASSWIPRDWMIPHPIHRRLRNFTLATNSLFQKKKCRSNLLWHQHLALANLQKDHRFLIVHCDKNLGPAIIEKEVYIQRALTDHLLDPMAYQHLSTAQALILKTTIKTKISDWLQKYKKSLSSQERRFIRHHLSTDTELPIFYMLIKVHKTPWSTRPIISCSGSLLYSLGVWVDRQLQKIATLQPSYIKNSKSLKDMLLDLVLPPGALLFTADAVSMYTNIDTSQALHSIGRYLHQNSSKFHDIPIDALMEALQLIMTNNVFSFGDTYWLQLTGTAMGTPPAPSYATIVYAIHEVTLLSQYENNLFFYRRYIDDVFGIWVPDLSISSTENDTIWSSFCTAMNHNRLQWVVNERSLQVDFLDITITIQPDRCISTKLYEKALNLYLYIPPHSAHPPGVIQALYLAIYIGYTTYVQKIRISNLLCKTSTLDCAPMDTSVRHCSLFSYEPNSCFNITPIMYHLQAPWLLHLIYLPMTECFYISSITLQIQPHHKYNMLGRIICYSLPMNNISLH